MRVSWHMHYIADTYLRPSDNTVIRIYITYTLKQKHFFYNIMGAAYIFTHDAFCLKIKYFRLLLMKTDCYIYWQYF